MIAGEGIFQKPGTRLKGIAVRSFYVEIVASIGGALYYAKEEVGFKFLDFESIMICLAILFGGIAVAYVASLFFYGVGEAMEHIAATKENSQMTREDVHKLVGKNSTSSGESHAEALERLTKLREKGILTDEEYQKQKEKLLAKA